MVKSGRHRGKGHGEPLVRQELSLLSPSKGRHAWRAYLKTPEQRFWEHVTKKDGCWLWTTPRGGNQGYGHLAIEIDGEKRKKLAHRFSWELHNGPIPSGLFVCHHCDEPRCVRPDHLFLGTNQENLADMCRKGRNAKGERSGFKRHPELYRGENHWARRKKRAQEQEKRAR